MNDIDEDSLLILSNSLMAMDLGKDDGGIDSFYYLLIKQKSQPLSPACAVVLQHRFKFGNYVGINSLWLQELMKEWNTKSTVITLTMGMKTISVGDESQEKSKNKGKGTRKIRSEFGTR